MQITFRLLPFYHCRHILPKALHSTHVLILFPSDHETREWEERIFKNLFELPLYHGTSAYQSRILDEGISFFHAMDASTLSSVLAAMKQ